MTKGHLDDNLDNSLSIYFYKVIIKKYIFFKTLRHWNVNANRWRDRYDEIICGKFICLFIPISVLIIKQLLCHYNNVYNAFKHNLNNLIFIDFWNNLSLCETQSTVHEINHLTKKYLFKWKR